MRKAISLLFVLVLAFPFCVPVSALAAPDTKVAEIALSDVLIQPDAAAANPTKTKDLARDFASSSATGTIKSIGQFVDFSSVIPSGSTIVSVTIYIPTSVTVTQSPYTVIENFVLTNVTAGSPEQYVKFVRTNSPSSTSKTTAFAGLNASSRWFVQIEGRIIQQYSGLDGFTVNAGGKMIVEYR